MLHLFYEYHITESIQNYFIFTKITFPTRNVVEKCLHFSEEINNRPIFRHPKKKKKKPHNEGCWVLHAKQKQV